MIYLDASALFKLVRAEPESAALKSYLSGEEQVSSELVLTELRRAAQQRAQYDLRVSAEDLQRRAAHVCDTLNLALLDRELLLIAGQIGPPYLRSLDAIHLVTALDAEPDSFVSYDRRQVDAARSAGLAVASPGI